MCQKPLLIILFAALASLSAMGSSQAAEAPGGAPPPPEVAVMEVRPTSATLTNELPGRTSAYLMAEVRPQVSGLIQKRLFEEGSDVEEGQLLYEIDPSTFEAVVESASANLTGAEKSAGSARAALASVEAAIEQQRAVLELAETNRKRLESLARNGAVSSSERDKAVTEAEVAQASLRSTEAQMKSQRQAVEVAEAAIGQASAALKAAQINLDHTKIKSPISGRIGRSQVTVGALVTAHQPMALATVQLLDPIYVDVPQSTAELLQLRRRMQSDDIQKDDSVVNKVRLILEDEMPYDHEGTLQFRDVTVEQSTGSVILRMSFPNPSGFLLPGMFVRTVLIEGIKEDAILVPQQAVTRDPRANPQAMVVNARNEVEVRPLTLDRALGDQWLVSNGLAPGDKLIVEGLQMVRPGVAVRTVPYRPAPAQTPGPAATSQQAQ